MIQFRFYLIVGAFLVSMSFTNYATAATRTWDGEGTDGDWSTCENWSSDTCPTSTDAVLFDGVASVKDSIVDAAFGGTVTSISITSGYTGTTTLARALTVSGTGVSFSHSGGGLDISGQILTLSGSSGSLISSGGTFVASNATTTFSSNSGTQTLTCTGTWPGVLDPGSSTASFTLSSGCNATLAKTISKQGSITLAGDATAQVGSTITLSVLTVSSNLTVTGSLAGLANLATTTFSGSASTQALTCTGTWPGILDPGSSTASFTLSSGCNATLAKTISKQGSITLAGDATAQVGSTITLSVLTVSSNLTVTGSLAGLANLATTTFSGNASTQTLTCTGTWPGILDPGSGVSIFSLASGCVITLSSNVNKPSTIFVRGTIDFGDNNFTATKLYASSTAILKLTGGQSTFKQPTYYDEGSVIEYTGTGAYASLKAGSSYSNLKITGSGSFSTSTAITVTGDFWQSAGTFSPSATTTFSGSSNATATTTSGSNFSSVDFNKTSATTTLAGAGLQLTGNLVLSSGGLDASASSCSSASCDITLAGNWNGGNNLFTSQSGTVSFNGNNQLITGTTTFYNLTKTISSADTLTFGSGETQTISNTWTAQGASGNLLTLAASSPGTAWLIDPQGTRSIEYLIVSDSNNINATNIDAVGFNVTNNSNNTGWTFVIAPTPTPTPTPTATSVLGGSFFYVSQIPTPSPTPTPFYSSTVTVTERNQADSGRSEAELSIISRDTTVYPNYPKLSPDRTPSQTVIADDSASKTQQIILVQKSSESTSTPPFLTIAFRANEGAGLLVGLMLLIFSYIRLPFSTSNIGVLFFHLYTLITVYKFSHKRFPWGTVYDSETKAPLDPAYVELFNESGNKIGESFTDIDGRYGFVVEPGKYSLNATKSHHTFPSIKLRGRNSDILYRDLTFGEPIEVGREGSINKNIPLDPIGFDWNQLEIQRRGLTRFYRFGDPVFLVFFTALFYVGFLITLWQFVSDVTILKSVLLLIYIVIFIARLLNPRQRLYGNIMDSSGKAIPFAILRLYSVENGIELAHKTADIYGRYFLLTAEDKSYRITIEKRTGNETYTGIHEETLGAKHGIINKNITVS